MGNRVWHAGLAVALFLGTDAPSAAAGEEWAKSGQWTIEAAMPLFEWVCVMKPAPRSGTSASKRRVQIWYTPNTTPSHQIMLLAGLDPNAPVKGGNHNATIAFDREGDSVSGEASIDVDTEKTLSLETSKALLDAIERDERMRVDLPGLRYEENYELPGARAAIKLLRRCAADVKDRD